MSNIPSSERPRIVVLDGHTATPATAGGDAPAGEPDWSGLQALGDLTVYERTTPEQLAERAAGAQVLVTNKTVLRADTLGALPELRFVSTLSTGTDAVDLEAAAAGGVVVSNVPGYSSASVAQHVFALLLELTNRTAEHARKVADGDWAKSPDFTFRTGPLHELQGRTLGVVGFGDIGQAVARVGAALGMKVVAHTRTERKTDLPVRFVDKATLLGASDVVSLHCPLTDATRGFIDGEALGLMPTHAFLINTARGPLIDEAALAETLHANRLAGAGLDVLSAEPPAADHPLTGHPQCGGDAAYRLGYAGGAAAVDGGGGGERGGVFGGAGPERGERGMRCARGGGQRAGRPFYGWGRGGGGVAASMLRAWTPNHTNFRTWTLAGTRRWWTWAISRRCGGGRWRRGALWRRPARWTA